MSGSSEPIRLDRDALVCVARDEFDLDRSILVRAEDLANYHWATDTGGKPVQTVQPRLAGYMLPSLIPAGAPFGYHGSHHSGREVPIKVLVQEPGTDATVLDHLAELAKTAKLRGKRRMRKVRPIVRPTKGA